MTVKELINELEKVENKDDKVVVFSNCEWEEVTVVINPNNESVGLFNGEEK